MHPETCYNSGVTECMYIVPLVKTVPAGNMPYMTQQHHSAQKFSAKLLIIPDSGNFISSLFGFFVVKIGLYHTNSRLQTHISLLSPI